MVIDSIFAIIKEVIVKIRIRFAVFGVCFAEKF